MNELEQLKAKYQELGAVIERMEKGEAEFKPLTDGYLAMGLGDILNMSMTKGSWQLCKTRQEAERLGKIFQAVAEQEHLVRFVNGDWDGINGVELFLDKDNGKVHTNMTTSYPSSGSPLFKDNDAAERALKLASPNLLAYWEREL